MHETSSSEEADTRDFTVRETERLKFITGRGAEEKEDEKGKGREEEEEVEEGGEEVERKEVLSPSLILFNAYSALEEEVLAKVGMTKRQKSQQERRASGLTTSLKSLLKP
jgi:hypothetical protein